MCIFNKRELRVPKEDNYKTYCEERQRRAQENYDKGMAEWEVFKDKPFKYKVGDKFICWLIVDTEKKLDEYLSIDIVGGFSLGLVHFWDNYHLINTITGVRQNMAEKEVDFLAKAKDIEDNLK